MLTADTGTVPECSSSYVLNAFLRSAMLCFWIRTPGTACGVFGRVSDFPPVRGLPLVIASFATAAASASGSIRRSGFLAILVGDAAIAKESKLTSNDSNVLKHMVYVDRSQPAVFLVLLKMLEVAGQCHGGFRPLLCEKFLWPPDRILWALVPLLFTSSLE